MMWSKLKVSPTSSKARNINSTIELYCSITANFTKGVVKLEFGFYFFFFYGLPVGLFQSGKTLFFINELPLLRLVTLELLPCVLAVA